MMTNMNQLQQFAPPKRFLRHISWSPPFFAYTPYYVIGPDCATRFFCFLLYAGQTGGVYY